MLKPVLKPVLTLILAGSLINTVSAVQLFGDVEVSRLPTAETTMGEVVTRYQALDDGLTQQLSSKKKRSRCHPISGAPRPQIMATGSTRCAVRSC